MPLFFQREVIKLFRSWKRTGPILRCHLRHPWMHGGSRAPDTQVRSRAKTHTHTHTEGPGIRIVCEVKITCIALCTITFSKAKSTRTFFWRQPVTFCKDRWLKPLIWLFSWWLENSPGYVYSLDKVQLKMHPGLNNLCNNDLKTPNTILHCMQVSQQGKALSGLTTSYPLSTHAVYQRGISVFTPPSPLLEVIHYFISICISIWP